MGFSGPTSIIIGTHNDLNIVEYALAALASQTFRDLELVIADDGSKEDYSPALQKWAPRFHYGIQHVTHEKQGFRKARILNRAVKVSRFDPLIVMDMDCIPHRDFVRNHLAYVQKGTAITGRRTHVGLDVLPAPEDIVRDGMRFSLVQLVTLRLRAKARIIEHGFVSPVLYESRNLRLHGSNFSVSRQHLLAVNGWNEEFQGWGNEDSELGVRLQNSGVRIRNLRNKVIQFHVMHERLPSVNLRSDELLRRAIADKLTRAPVGLAQIQDGDFTWTGYGAALTTAAQPSRSLRS